jgi:dolichol-phosphate mannosyltransferase
MSRQKVLTALPVYNEVNHLEPVLSEVRKYSQAILVVDDGSTDGTSKLLDELSDLFVIHHPTNRGYGAGLRSAFEFAQEHEYDAIDCDGQHQPCLIPSLAESLKSPEDVDIVSGSRYLQSFAGDTPPPEARRAINMRFNQLIQDELGLNLTDSFCGFKAYRVSALSRLDVTEFGYAMPMQFWVQVVAQNLKFREYPVPLIYLEEERSFGGSLDDSEQRLKYYLEVFEAEKHRWKDELVQAKPKQFPAAEAPTGCSF